MRFVLQDLVHNGVLQSLCAHCISTFQPFYPMHGDQQALTLLALPGEQWEHRKNPGFPAFCAKVLRLAFAILLAHEDQVTALLKLLTAGKRGRHGFSSSERAG